MPLLGSKRLKTDLDALNTANGDRIADSRPGTAVSADSGSSKSNKSAPLRAKASSPQLLPRTNGPSRPGLNRNFSRSWYGSWNNKASATSEVARESISVSAGIASTSPSQNSMHESQATKHMHALKNSEQLNPDRRGLAESKALSGKTVSTKEQKELRSGSGRGKAGDQDKGSTGGLAYEVDAPDMVVAIRSAAEPDKYETSQSAPSDTSWLGWWSRPDGHTSSIAGASHPTDKSLGGQQQSRPLSSEDPVPISKSSNEPSKRNTTQNAEGPQFTISTPTSASRAWFGLWSTAQSRERTDSAVTNFATDGIQRNVSPNDVPNLRIERMTVQSCVTSADTAQKSTSWAFWSKDSSRSSSDSKDRRKHEGEVAIADTPSESRPEAAQLIEETKPPTRQKQAAKKTTTKQVEGGEKTAIKIDTSDKHPSGPTAVASAKNASTVTLPTSYVSDPSALGKNDSRTSAASKTLSAQQIRPNLVEPSFHSNYPYTHVPSYLETLGYYLAYPLGWYTGTGSASRHISKSRGKPSITTAIAIGVHGYFPAPLVQKIIGQPTGTSIKFASHAATAIRSWVEKNQPGNHCDIDQVALEGEGFISDRVTTLWNLLLNWLAKLRKADLILVAAHSQGVPVAVMLVAKLIQLGCLAENVKIGICAMAGVNLGPFADYKSRFFGGSAAELFEFSRPESRVSREYASAMEVILRYGVRVTFVGSLDDQLVSLESSTFSNLDHPYIHRAVFVDGRHHATDFITSLVIFALRLRNLGISDHGLIRELSAPLAGSIYGGEGHSRVYDDDAVYSLALAYALETTDVKSEIFDDDQLLSPRGQRRQSKRQTSESGSPLVLNHTTNSRSRSLSAAAQPGIPPTISSYEVPANSATANPFILPWAMRGILEEPQVRSEMQEEVADLIQLFDGWKPSTKALKDVKFRLEAVKSKL